MSCMIEVKTDQNKVLDSCHMTSILKVTLLQLSFSLDTSSAKYEGCLIGGEF